MTLLWSLFDLQNVIGALLASRLLVQFAAQIVGLFLLRRAEPERARPFRIWLAPIPCGLALAGFVYVWVTLEGKFLIGSLLTLASGLAAFPLWSRRLGQWPFA